MKVKLLPSNKKISSIRSIKLLVAEMDEAAILAQRATGLLLTVSFVVLPILWSNLIQIIGASEPTTNSCPMNCNNNNYDPWLEFNQI